MQKRDTMSRGMEAIGVVVTLVIALVLAILVISIMAGKFGTFTKATSCAGQGTCSTITSPCPPGALELATDDCSPQRCCVVR